MCTKNLTNSQFNRAKKNKKMEKLKELQTEIATLRTATERMKN